MNSKESFRSACVDWIVDATGSLNSAEVRESLSQLDDGRLRQTVKETYTRVWDGEVVEIDSPHCSCRAWTVGQELCDCGRSKVHSGIEIQYYPSLHILDVYYSLDFTPGGG